MPFELIRPGTNYDFIGKWKICAALSALLIGISLLAIPVNGFRLGIDFAGGVEAQARFGGEQPVDEGQVREVVEDLGIPNASVIRYGLGDTREFLVRFAGERELPSGAPDAPKPPAEMAAVPDPAAPDPAAPDEAAKSATGEAPAGDAPAAAPAAGEATPQTAQGDLVARLAVALQERIGPVDIVRVEFVGPNVGSELRRDGLLAIAVACVLILVYIWFRFSFRFAPGAVAALVHDVAITSGVFLVFGLEFDLRVLAALLAILGYSLNDTIIVYDRIRENMELRTSRDLADVLNQSVNQTLSRTLLTSVAALMACFSLLFLGGEVLRPFALAMIIGIVVGTYSSIYVAAPILLLLGRWLQPVATGKPRAAKQTA